MSWAGQGPLGRSGTGRGTLKVVRDGSLDPWNGQGRVGGPSRTSWTVRWTLEEDRDGSGYPREGPRWFVGPSIGEVRDGSRDPLRGTGRVAGPTGRSGTVRWTIGKVQGGSETSWRFGMGREPLGRSGTVRGTLREVRHGLGDLGEVRDGSDDPWEGLGWVEGPSIRYEMVQDVLLDPRKGPGRV